MKPTDDQHRFVEQVGRWWELVGSRSAGRILGWLMICEPPQRSAAQIAADLQLSAGSVSTQTTMLENVGFLERVTFPGDRSAYYQLKEHVWVEQMRTEASRVLEMKRLAEAAGDVIPTERPDRVTDMVRVSDFFLEIWPEVMERLTDHMQKATKK